MSQDETVKYGPDLPEDAEPNDASATPESTQVPVVEETEDEDEPVKVTTPENPGT